MMYSMLFQISRLCTWICVVLLLCTTVPVMAKYPELGGLKQFDLSCRGQYERILEPYIFVPMAGPGREEPRIAAVQKHITVDMISMQFLEKGQYHPVKIPQEKDGLLYLYNAPASLLWTINLDTYKSIAVQHDESGALYVEKMRCRPTKFSGFPFVPSSVEEVRKMIKRQK